MPGSCDSILHVYSDAASFRSKVTTRPDDEHHTVQDLQKQDAQHTGPE